MTLASNPCSETEVRVWQIRGYPRPQVEFEATLNCRVTTKK